MSTSVRHNFWLFVSVLLVFGDVGAGSPAVTAQGNSDAAHACQKGGFMWLAGSGGQVFANAGQCTSFVAQGGAFADPGTFVIVPQGFRVTIDGMWHACNELTFGFVTSDGSSGILGGKAAGCLNAGAGTFVVGPFGGPVVLSLSLQDLSCGAVYTSDGGGNASHAIVSGSYDNFYVGFADAGPACGIMSRDHTPFTQGNLDLWVAVHP